MIGKLRGVVDSVEVDHCIVDVGGVGYVAFCPAGALAGLAGGAEATLLIETVVREDMIRLYGFATAVEREWFRSLQANVQGVGPKVALSVLSVLSPSALAAAVTSGDVAAICKAHGVGKKVAERIISEMKGKVPEGSEEGPATVHSGAADEAVSALVALGYPRAKAVSGVAKVLEAVGPDADVSALIRQALRSWADPWRVKQPEDS